MADRYWVGGTASWDGTAGTKWAATSNGPGGETVPTTADDVFFDASSSGTVTIATGNTGAKSINCTGFTGTLTGTAAITVAGSITLDAGMTYTHTGTVTISGTGTLTTAGKTFSGVTVNGSGITVTLGDALNISTRTLIVTQGTFTTSASNYNITAASLSSSNSNGRTISLNGSTVTLSAIASITFTTSTNLTFNAGTSQISLSGTSATLAGGSQTFYNVSFTNTGTGTHTISGANTFNNLTFAGITSAGLKNISVSANQTVSGTLTFSAGTNVTMRNFVFSGADGATVASLGSTITLTVAAFSGTDVDFRSITIAGVAAPISGTRFGDAGGNSGITFDSPKTVYWNLAGNQSWSATGWATTQAGTPAVNNFPLPQDTAIFTNQTATQDISVNQAYNYASIDSSSRTNTLRFLTGSSNNRVRFCGDLILSSNTTVTDNGSTSDWMMIGYKNATFTPNGASFSDGLIIEKIDATVTLGGNLSPPTARSISLVSGGFNAANYDITCTTFASSNSNTRTITMGSGTWTLSGTGTVWNTGTTTGLTFNKDTANIILSDTTTTARTFAGGGLTYNKLTIGGATGTSTLTFTGSNTFSELASTKTVAHTLSFTAGTTTTVEAWTVTGTSGNVVTIQSATAASHTLTKTGGGTVSTDYMSISRSTATPSSTWYAGTNSTDGGNNSGWSFTAAPSTATGNFLMFM